MRQVLSEVLVCIQHGRSSFESVPPPLSSSSAPPSPRTTAGTFHTSGSAKCVVDFSVELSRRALFRRPPRWSHAAACLLDGHHRRHDQDLAQLRADLPV